MTDSAFTREIADVLADPNLGEDAVYMPVAGVAVAVRVVLSLHDPTLQLGGFETTAQAPGWTGLVAAEQLNAAPVEGDTLATADRTFTVRSFRRDVGGHAWQLDLLRTGGAP